MHLLIATNNIFPDPGAGGSGRYVTEIGKRLISRGHDVSVVTKRRDDTPERGSIEGMDVFRYDGSPVALPRSARSVADWCQEINRSNPVDLINFHGPLSASLVDRSLPRPIPRSYTFHGPWPAEYRERNRERPSVIVKAGTRARALVERRALQQSDLGITLSDFMRRQMNDWHPNAPTGPVIPGGVDIDRFTPNSPRLGSIDAGLSFLTVRRLTPRMGLESLLDAFAAVGREVPDAHLYIAGDGPLRSALESRADSLGLESSVTFLGFVEEQALASVYAAADVFVLPTTALEGFGLVTLEALASGTPVLATGVGGTPEILSPLDRSLPDSPDMLLEQSDSMRNGLLNWANCRDSVREQAGERGRQYVCDNFSWEVTTDALVDVFTELAETGSI